LEAYKQHTSNDVIQRMKDIADSMQQKRKETKRLKHVCDLSHCEKNERKCKLIIGTYYQLPMNLKHWQTMLCTEWQPDYWCAYVWQLLCHKY